MSVLDIIASRMHLNMSQVPPDMRGLDNTKKVTTLTWSPPNEECQLKDERRCEDGQCVSSVDLCPEEQLMNQNTILIMIVVGLAVVIFLIILYCFQQRSRGVIRNRTITQTDGQDDEDRISLYLPPPTYEEVVTTDLYPPTPQMHQRGAPLTSIDEGPPLTPPPNYNTALQILARSHESVLLKPPFPRRQSSIISRRTLSAEFVSQEESESFKQEIPVTEKSNNKNNDIIQIEVHNGETVS